MTLFLSVVTDFSHCDQVHKRIASHVFHHHRRILELAVRVKAARLIALQLETYSDFHRTTTSIYVFALKYYETSRISYREWRMNHPIKTLSGSLAEGATLSPLLYSWTILTHCSVGVVGKEVLDNVGRQTIIPCLNCGTTLSPRYRADKGFCDNCCTYIELLSPLCVTGLNWCQDSQTSYVRRMMQKKS